MGIEQKTPIYFKVRSNERFLYYNFYLRVKFFVKTCEDMQTFLN